MGKTEQIPDPGMEFDANALREKYRQERDKRLRPDGSAQYMEYQVPPKSPPASMTRTPSIPASSSRAPASRTGTLAANATSNPISTFRSSRNSGTCRRRSTPMPRKSSNTHSA